MKRLLSPAVLRKVKAHTLECLQVTFNASATPESPNQKELLEMFWQDYKARTTADTWRHPETFCDCLRSLFWDFEGKPQKITELMGEWICDTEEQKAKYYAYWKKHKGFDPFPVYARAVWTALWQLSWASKINPVRI